jgi:phenylacetate-CoA ligase
MSNKVEDFFMETNYAWLRNLAVNFYGWRLYRKRFTKDFRQELEQLEYLEALSVQELEQIQSAQLRVMVHHAYQNVPFYKKQFDKIGLSPHSIQTVQDIGCIPILEREDIQGNYDQLLARNVPSGSYTLHHTSGTSGMRLDFAISNYLQWTLKFGHLYRHYAWAGIKPGDRRVTLGGRVFTKKPPYWSYNCFESQLLLSIHHLTIDTVDQYIKEIKNFAPAFIQGHPSGIARLAQRVVELESDLRVSAVFTTGETLDHEQRKLIETAFQTSVYDFYGQGEGLFYAGECAKHLGFHEFSWMGIIEMVSTTQGVEEKDVIGTSLHNFAMPMLRYRLDDLAVPASQSVCSCGCGYPLKIKKVIGRVDDRIYLSENPTDYILPVTIRMHIKPFLKTGQNYQLHQLDLDRFILRISSPQTVHNQPKNAMEKAVKKIVGENAHIDVLECDSLLTTGGKIRNIISDIARQVKL